MTKQVEVKDDPRYRAYLDHGFVGLVETMGSDFTIDESARMSYGQGTRSVSDTRNLLRYLIRNYHTSPIEMGEVRFHLKIPIFVMRQLVRHRTANLNEYSGRYSEMVDEFYLPEQSRIQLQSTTNKQGSGDQLATEKQRKILKRIQDQHETAYGVYRESLDDGVARELARITLPVSNYTELYWKCDLNNFFKMLRLRMDPHAQKEIVDMANLMYELAKPHFPLCFEAFEDYHLNGVSLSQMEIGIIKLLMGCSNPRGEVEYFLEEHHLGKMMSKREKDEFKAKLGL